MLSRFLAVLFVLVLAIQSGSCAVFSTEFEVYKNDSVSLRHFELVNGGVFIPRSGEGYSIQLLGEKDEVIADYGFGIDFYIEYHQQEGFPVFKEMDPSFLQFAVQYNDSMKKMRLLHGEKVIFAESLLFCDDNGACSGYENALSCPADCATGEDDGYCDGVVDGKCDPDCGVFSGLADEDCRGPSGSADGYCDGLEDGVCDSDCLKGADLDCEEKRVEQDLGVFALVGASLAVVAVVLFLLSRRKKKVRN